MTASVTRAAETSKARRRGSPWQATPAPPASSGGNVSVRRELVLASKRNGARRERSADAPPAIRSETRLNCSAGSPYPALARLLLTQGQSGGVLHGTRQRRLLPAAKDLLLLATTPSRPAPSAPGAPGSVFRIHHVGQQPRRQMAGEAGVASGHAARCAERLARLAADFSRCADDADCRAAIGVHIASPSTA